MNKIFLYLTLIICFGCNNNSKKTDVNIVRNPLTASDNSNEVKMPRVEILNEIINFGEIKQGEIFNAEFIIKNVGNAPLLIRSVNGSCGCTVPKWTSEELDSGSSTIINVAFDSSGKSGQQRKTVALVTNAIPSTKVLTINGTVIVPSNN